MNKNEVVDQTRQGILLLSRLMVDTPDGVHIEVVEANPGLAVLSLYTTKGEEGTAIGKGGVLAEAIRDLVYAISVKHQHWIQYEVVSDWTHQPANMEVRNDPAE
jgi:predicted RNA-binding protein YlqC (UPF0109 family)